MHLLRLIIPDGVVFADLKVRRMPTGGFEVHRETLCRVAVANGFTPADLALDDVATDILIVWYREHLARGGSRDRVMDQSYAEAAAEEAFGQERIIRGPVDPQ